MAQVTETLVDATGAPLAGRRVRAWLVPVGYDTTGGSRRTVASVEQPAVTTTDASGVWTLDLVPNADIEVPTGSYYKVERPGGTVSIVVTSGGPHQLADLLVDSPTAPDASALAAHVVTSGLTGGHLPVAGDPGDVLTTLDGETWTSEPAGASSHPDLAAHDALGLATQAELDAGLAGKAATGHNHDGTYSAAAHNHSSVYDPAGTSSTHAAASDHPNLHSTGTPANLGVAGRGTGTQAARDDHVHAMPSASDVGAATSGHNHDAAYSATGHNHDASYSASGHDHSGVYDPAGTSATHAAASDPHGDRAHAVQRANHTGSQAISTVTGLQAALDGKQPLDSDLTAIAALSTTSFGRALLELLDAAAGRTAFGLGSIATQAANNVAITGGSVSGITDLPVADGGTGASDAATARTNLGVPSDPAAATAGMRTLGTGATQAAAGNDSRLSDTRTPTDGSVTNAKVATGAAIDLAKLASISTARVLGRTTAGSGAIEELTAAQGRTVLRAADSHAPLGWGLITTGDLIGANNTVAWNTANRASYIRALGAGDITKIGLEVTTQSGNISLAVYRNSGSGRAATLGTRLATTGAIACPAVGYVEVSLGSTVSLEPGDWFAMSCDNTTAAFRHLHANVGGLLPAGRAAYENSAHPCPSAPVPIFQAFGRAVALVGVP